MAKPWVLLDVCSACGSRCKYCVHQSKRLCKRDSMSREAFTAITDILLREGYRNIYLYFTGEPLLNPLYPEFLASCGARGFSGISTATKLNAKVKWDEIDRALRACRKSDVFFLVGIDSLDDVSLKAISPGASAELLNLNLAKLSKVAARHPKTVRVLATTVVTRPNESSLAKIEARCRSLGFGWSRREMGFFMSRHADQADIADVAKLVPSCGTSRFRIENGVVISGRSKCDDSLEPGISPTGDVVVCCHDMLYESVVGNILEAGSLDSIMSSARYLEVLGQCRKMKAVFCKGCS